MIDRQLRRMTARVFEPLAARLSGVAPWSVTAVGALVGVGAAVAAAAGYAVVSVVVWLLNRAADGLDGPLARTVGAASDRGGYLDMMADVLIYAVVPIGLAIRLDDAWPATAVLLASFYLNAVSWLYLSAVAERRAAGAANTGESTSVHMPTGLIEGTETIVIYAAMLLLPQHFEVLAWAMAALVGVTIVQRLVSSRRL